MGIKRTREEVAGEIERFLAGTGGPWAWDDFISIPISDPQLDRIRRRCGQLREQFPPDVSSQYCGAGGMDVMRSMISDLRGSAV